MKKVLGYTLIIVSTFLIVYGVFALSYDVKIGVFILLGAIVLWSLFQLIENQYDIINLLKGIKDKNKSDEKK